MVIQQACKKLDRMLSFIFLSYITLTQGSVLTENITDYEGRLKGIIYFLPKYTKGLL